MNYFQPQKPNREENIQNNLPGKMLNNYFQPNPRHEYPNDFFAGGPSQEQQPSNPAPPQYSTPPTERIDEFFPGASNGNGPSFTDFIPDQLADNIFPSPPDNNGNGPQFPNWPPAPSFPDFQGNEGGNGNGAPSPDWPSAPSFPGFQGNGNGGPSGQQQGPEMAGMNSQPPMGPPPNFVPEKQNVQTFAVDPGGIMHCRFRFTYIWPNHGRGFWAFPTFVGRNSIAGFRWNGFRWVYFGMDLNRIESFQCM